MCEQAGVEGRGTGSRKGKDGPRARFVDERVRLVESRVVEEDHFAERERGEKAPC